MKRKRDLVVGKFFWDLDIESVFPGLDLFKLNLELRRCYLFYLRFI
jgi:hypothetical protein